MATNEHTFSALRLQRRWTAFARLFVLMAALLVPAGAAVAAPLVVRFDEAVFGLREASAAADEARIMFLGLNQADVELTPEGAVFTADPEQKARLADMFRRAMPADSRIVATLRRDGSVLVAYRSDLLKANLPDIHRAIPFVRAKLAAAGAGEVSVTALEDGRLEIHAEPAIEAETVESLLNESIGLQVRVVDCYFGPHHSPESTCDSAGERFEDPYNGGILWIERAPFLTIDQFERWGLDKDPLTGSKMLTWRLTPEGRRRLSAFTHIRTGAQVAFIVHGRVFFAPRIMAPLTGGQGVVTLYGEDQTAISERLSELKAYAPPLPFVVRAAP